MFRAGSSPFIQSTMAAHRLVLHCPKIHGRSAPHKHGPSADSPPLTVTKSFLVPAGMASKMARAGGVIS